MEGIENIVGKGGRKGFFFGGGGFVKSRDCVVKG